jgi:hypothetical protein
MLGDADLARRPPRRGYFRYDAADTGSPALDFTMLICRVDGRVSRWRRDTVGGVVCRRQAADMPAGRQL